MQQSCVYISVSDSDKDLDLHIDDLTQTLEYLQFEFKLGCA